MAVMTTAEAVVVALHLNTWAWAWAGAGGVLVVVFIRRVLEWIWWRPKKLESLLRQQGLSGNPYRLYYGDLRDASRMLYEAKSKPMDSFSNNYMPRARPFLYQTIKNYGKNSFFWEGPVPVVNVGDANLMREVFNRYTEFQKPITNPVISKLFLRGLVAYEGDKWAQHRKLINPAFHMEKLKLMVPSLYTSSNEIVSKWEKMLSQGVPRKEVDVFPDLISLSADAISRAAFGSSFEEGGRLFQLIKDQLVVVARMNLSVYFPGKRFLPTSDNKKMKELDEQIRSIITGIIDKRRKLEKESKYDDLLGLLMANTNNNNNNNKHKQMIKVGLTTEELIQECKLFYLAGQETTSNLLTWTMLLLSKHQHWQTRAREEVLATFGDKQPADFEGLNQLKVMNMIFHEVLRLYPPVVELRRAVARDNTKLGKHLTLPKGVQINLPIVFAHHDIDQWGDDPDPFEFNPERFSEGISKASKYNKYSKNNDDKKKYNNNNAVAFLPFGWGPRICIGLNFAMIEAKLAFAMILQRFQFDLSPAYAHAPVSYPTLTPQFGARVILTHHHHNHRP